VYAVNLSVPEAFALASLNPILLPLIYVLVAACWLTAGILVEGHTRWTR